MRLTDDDRTFGPLRWGRAGWNHWAISLDIGEGHDEYPYRAKVPVAITVYAFQWCFRLTLPIKTKNREQSYENGPLEFGFSYNNGHFMIRYGQQTHASNTDKSWGKFLPWTQWRWVRTSYYTPEWKLFGEQLAKNKGGIVAANSEMKMRENCPAETHLIKDYDGTFIHATCRIQVMEWRFGEGWFKWFSWFVKPKIHRFISIEFDKEVGPMKGSWKGGITGHSADLLPGEDIDDALMRYCDTVQNHKGQNYKLAYIGFVGPELCSEPSLL